RTVSSEVAAARVERVKGIEPSYAAWEAAVLPLNYTRISCLARVSRTHRGHNHRAADLSIQSISASPERAITVANPGPIRLDHQSRNELRRPTGVAQGCVISPGIPLR